MRTNNSVKKNALLIVLATFTLRLAMAQCYTVATGNSNGTPQPAKPTGCVAITYSPPNETWCEVPENNGPGKDACTSYYSDVCKVSTTFTYVQWPSKMCVYPVVGTPKWEKTGKCCEQDFIPNSANSCGGN